MKKLFVTDCHRGGGQLHCLTKNCPQNKGKEKNKFRQNVEKYLLKISKKPILIDVKNIYSKTKFSFSYLFMAFVLSLFCFPQISISPNIVDAPTDAFTYNDTSFSKIDEIYNGDGTFDKTNFEKLLQQTSGISTLTSASLSALNTKVTSANITAKNMNSYSTGGKSSGQDIVVRMGGLDWTPTYLSKTKSGNLILTMWLSNNEQDAFQSRTSNAAEGAYYGFVKNPNTNRYGLYSDWSADWHSSDKSQGTAAFYPSNMYGSSYIRSVTLNNGGRYATSNTVLAADPGQKTTSIFAPFTMSSNALSSFIVTPSEVSWQETQSATATKGAVGSYDYPNDEWNPSTAKGKYISDAVNYVEHNGYDTWKNDKLWLPSLAETGYTFSPKTGLWGSSTNQRSNSDGSNGSNTSFTASSKIGSSNSDGEPTKASTYSWLRSGGDGIANYAYYLYSTGTNVHSYNVDICAAVRPALHLNLTKAAQNIKVATSTTTLTWTPVALNGHIYYYTELGTYNSKSIKWWIMDGQNPATATQVDVISDTVLMNRVFATDNSSWDKCSLRTYANGDFYTSSGLKASGKVIQKSNMSGQFYNDSAIQTSDYVWILSYTDVVDTYCPHSDSEGKFYLASHRATGGSSATASEAELYTTEQRNSSRMGTYWLRSDGLSFGSVEDRACYISPDGIILDQLKANSYGFRPCLRLDNTKKVIKGLTFDNLISAYPGITKASDGYHITDYTGLVAMSDYSYTNDLPTCFNGDTFYLDNDIDCSALDFDFKAIKYFSGTIDGQGHSIINLNCGANAPAYQGPSDVGFDDSNMGCFIWGTLGMSLTNINFLNLNIGSNSDFAPGALIGGNVFAKNPYSTVAITLVNVYCECNALSYGLISGFIVDASGWTVNFARCTMIQKSPDIYGISSIPNVRGCSAFVGVVESTKTNINILYSFAYGFYNALLPMANSANVQITCTYLFGIYPDESGWGLPVGMADKEAFTTFFVESRKVYWNFTGDTIPWAYNDNLMLGLPYHPLIAKAADINALDKIESWIAPNLHGNSEVLTRLQDCGFTEETIPW